MNLSLLVILRMSLSLSRPYVLSSLGHMLKYKICWLAPTGSCGNVVWMELAHSGYLVPLEYVNMNPFLSTKRFPRLPFTFLSKRNVDRGWLLYLSAFVVIDCFPVVCGTLKKWFTDQLAFLLLFKKKKFLTLLLSYFQTPNTLICMSDEDITIRDGNHSLFLFQSALIVEVLSTVAFN